MIRKLLLTLSALAMLCGCAKKYNPDYSVVVGKDKRFQKMGNSMRETYIVSVKQGDFPRSFDFSVTLGYYNKVNVGDTIIFAELCSNLN